MGEFITPPSLPPTTYCRRLLIPNTPEWIGTVTGALMALIYPSSWIQTTGITQEEASSRAQVMFDLYLNSGNDGECGDTMACCETQVVIRRYDPVTGQAQISIDDGLTWTTDPLATENQIPLYPPIVYDGSTSTKCDAATNASEHINELITSTGTNLAASATVFELAAAIAEAALAIFVVVVSGGALSPLVATLMAAIWGAATGALALGVDAYNTYWTTDKKDAILCSLFCSIGDNGQFTEAQYQAFRSDIKGKLPASPAFNIVMTTINAGGATGLSQMASYGNAADADCASCECTCLELLGFKTDGFATIVSLDEETCQVTLASVVNPNTGSSPQVIGFDFGTGCGYITIISVTGKSGSWENGIMPCGGTVEEQNLIPFSNRCVNYSYVGSTDPFQMVYQISACP